MLSRGRSCNEGLASVSGSLTVCGFRSTWLLMQWSGKVGCINIRVLVSLGDGRGCCSYLNKEAMNKRQRHAKKNGDISIFRPLNIDERIHYLYSTTLQNWIATLSRFH